MTTYGPLGGRVETTGLRYDPVTGRSSTAPSDFGRAYVTTNTAGALQITNTMIQTESYGAPAITYGSGVKGTLLVRGNLVSTLIASSGISGTLAVEGDFGQFSTLLSTTNPTRIGGIGVGFKDTTGKIIGLGRMIGHLNLLGGLDNTGSVAIKGGILGNSIVNGLAPGTSILSGGLIGDPALGTSFAFQTNRGIVAAKGAIVNKNNTATGPGYWSSNASQVPDGIDAGVIDAIFTDSLSRPLGGFDYTVFSDSIGLTNILFDLFSLDVVGGRLSL